jgi:AraC-like DNA-binding protein
MGGLKHWPYPSKVGRFVLNSDYRIIHYVDFVMQDVEPHNHNFYECIVCLNGDLRYRIGKQTYQVFPGDIVMVNIAEVHHPIMISANTPYDRICLTIDRSFLLELSYDKTDLCDLFENSNHRFVLHPSIKDYQTIKLILSKLEKLYEDQTVVGFDLLSRAYLIECFIYLARINPVENNLMSSGKAPRIDQIKRYISLNYHTKLSLEQIADEFFINKYYLAHYFKQNTSMSVHSYITKVRLTVANDLLRKGTPVDSVCAECGFYDLSTFYRVYKKEYGLTPREWLGSIS